MLWSRFGRKKRYYLSCFAIFRNEAVLLNEWINHYRRQGVEHFYLIDHGPSTDNSKKSVLHHTNAGLITFFEFNFTGPRAQIIAYKKQRFLSYVRTESEWIIMCDIDEFVVPRRGWTVQKLLRAEFERRADFIQIPGLFFGSSGHVAQPPNVLCHFTWRAHYNVTENTEGVPNWLYPTLTKYLVRTSALQTLDVHTAKTIPGARRVTGLARGPAHAREDVNMMRTKPTLFPVTINLWVNESDIEQAFFVSNHYRIMSRDWYVAVRGTRGNVMGGAGVFDPIPEMLTYDAHYNSMQDLRLSSITPYCHQNATVVRRRLRRRRSLKKNRY